MHHVQNLSNFPFTNDPNVDLCEKWPVVRIRLEHENSVLMSLDSKFTYFQGHYYLRNFEIDRNAMVPYIPPGRLRTFFLFYKKNEKYCCKGFQTDIVVT